MNYFVESVFLVNINEQFSFVLKPKACLNICLNKIKKYFVKISLDISKKNREYKILIDHQILNEIFVA
jgi:hypothetical protein